MSYIVCKDCVLGGGLCKGCEYVYSPLKLDEDWRVERLRTNAANAMENFKNQEFWLRRAGDKKGLEEFKKTEVENATYYRNVYRRYDFHCNPKEYLGVKERIYSPKEYAVIDDALGFYDIFFLENDMVVIKPIKDESCDDDTLIGLGCHSFYLTKEYVEFSGVGMSRPLGEIFGCANVNDLVLVGGGRGGRGGRGRGRISVPRYVRGSRGNFKKRKRVNDSNRNLGVIQPGRFMPDRFFATLRYDDPNLNRTLTAGTYNWWFQSDAYQCDTTGTANVVPGFSALNTMYNKSKVHKMILHYSITCNNTDPVMFVCWPSISNPGVTTVSKANLITYSSNPGGRRTLCGNTGGGVTRGMCVATGLKLFGPPFRFDDDYWAVGSGAPTIPYYINCGIFDTVAAEALPLVTDIRVEMVVEFSGLRSLLS